MLRYYNEFLLDPCTATAITASIHIWHMHEWHWHESNPGKNTRRSPEFVKFKHRLYTECPAMHRLGDIADAGKHRGLGRKPEIFAVKIGRDVLTLNGDPITIGKDTIDFGEALIVHLDGNLQYTLTETLKSAVSYWEHRLKDETIIAL